MFLQNGQWVPDQPVNAGMIPAQTNAGRVMLPAMPQGVAQIAQQFAPPQMQFQPQAQMQFNPLATLGNVAPPQRMEQAPQMPQLQQGGVLPDGPPDPGRQTMIGHFQMPQFQPQFVQAPQAPQSVMQSVNNNNPQSVFNFLQALHQTPQTAQSNAWQNPQGIQGQGPQAGFRGFQQSAQPQFQPAQWQGYNQGQQPQLGSVANQAQQGTGATQGGVSQPRNPQMPQFNAASDIQAKQNVAPATSELQEFLNSLTPYSYEYKDEKYGEGRRISPMAQDIEKTPLGASAISTNEEGYKIVDYGKLMGTQLAGLAMLNHKQNDMEKQLDSLKDAVLKGLKEKGKR